MIRATRSTDAAALTAVHNTLFPHQPHTRQSWLAHVDGILRVDGRVWTLLIKHSPVATAAIVPVPGLPGLMELEGFVAPRWQRQGWGTRLLNQITAELTGTAVSQLSYPVPYLHTPAAHFLRQNGFFIEHEEQMMEWTMVNGQSSIVNPHQPPTTSHLPLATCHLPLATATPLFCQLYTTCFASLPWSQPFTEGEVAATLQNREELLFLIEEDTPIGFVWVRPQPDNSAQLEPIGIIPTKQGQGYGRILLQLTLSQLARQGVTTVNLGVWTNNHTAVHLYQSLGFRQTESIIYLACNLNPS